MTGADGRRYPSARKPAGPAVLAQSRGEQDRAGRALNALGDSAPGKVLDLRRAERLARDAAAGARRTGPAPVLPGGATVVRCDLRDLRVAEASVGLVLTDPPYTAAAMPEWSALGALAARALRPGGLLVAYCGQMHLPEALARVTEHVPYWWCLAVVHDVGTGVGQVRQRNLGCAWKPLLVFRQPGGDALPAWTLDVVRAGRREKDTGHPWQQAEAEATALVDALTVPGELVLDPFCGSGTIPAAVLGAGRRVLACDRDPVAVDTARRRLAVAPRE